MIVFWSFLISALIVLILRISQAKPNIQRIEGRLQEFEKITMPLEVTVCKKCHAGFRAARWDMSKFPPIYDECDTCREKIR